MDVFDLRVLDIENLENCEMLSGYSDGFRFGVTTVCIIISGVLAVT